MSVGPREVGKEREGEMVVERGRRERQREMVGSLSPPKFATFIYYNRDLCILTGLSAQGLTSALFPSLLSSPNSDH